MPAKLDLLYDRLNSDDISEDLASKLREIAKSMENRRLDEAYPFRAFSRAYSQIYSVYRADLLLDSCCTSVLSFIPNTAFDGLLPAIVRSFLFFCHLARHCSDRTASCFHTDLAQAAHVHCYVSTSVTLLPPRARSRLQNLMNLFTLSS